MYRRKEEVHSWRVFFLVILFRVKLTEGKARERFVGWFINIFLIIFFLFHRFTTPSCTATAPAFEEGPGPAIAMVHSSATRSNTVSTSQFVVYEWTKNVRLVVEVSWGELTGIQRPILSQTTSGSYTFLSTGKRPRSPATPTATKAPRTPGCWKSLGCILVGFCRRSPGANRSASCSSDSARRCSNHWDIRRRPRRLCSTIGRLCRCVVSFAQRPRCGSHLRADRGRSARSSMGRWSHRRWWMAAKHGRSRRRVDSIRSSWLNTRTSGLGTWPAQLRAIVRPTNGKNLKGEALSIQHSQRWTIVVGRANRLITL